MSSEQKYSFYVEGKAHEVADRPRKFLEAFAAILDHSNYGLVLDAYTRMSAKCGRCGVTCQLYQETGGERDLPCHRSELLMRVYRRYFTQSGIVKARFFGGFSLTDQYVDEMAEAYYRCTACRRCKAACPLGIDHGLITHLGRWVLAEVGVIPKALVVATRQQLEGLGNTSAIPVPALKDTLEFLEEDFEEIYGFPIRFPIDVEGAEYVFFPAVSDYLLEPDTLMGNAAVMRVSGGSWTIGTRNFDGINYGLFYSDRMMERICRNVVAEVRRLKGEKILVGECGHATRSAWMIPNFLGADAPPVVNFLQYTWQAILDGKVPLKGKVIEERVTYHDPCNIARSGRITEEPREILKAICKDYVEMTPNRTENYCCGGGGGTVSIDEIRDFRTKTMGAKKAEQLRETGAQVLIAPCANCKKQLREIIEDHNIENMELMGLHDLLLKAIDFEPFKGKGDEPAEEEVTSGA